MHISPSGDFPPDPFAQAPNPDAVFVESAQAPGPAAELTTAAFDSLALHRSFATTDGNLLLRTEDGVQVHIAEGATHSSATAEIQPGAGTSLRRFAGAGLARWFADTFRGASTHYTVEVANPDGRDVTITAQKNEGDIAVAAWTHEPTPEGSALKELPDPTAVEAVLAETAGAIRRGAPVDPEVFLAERQQGPCEQIIGAEAAGVHATVERLFGKQRGLGSPTAKGERKAYEPTEADPSQQWPVQNVTVVKRPGGWRPTMRGAEGRVVLTHTQFTKTLASEVEQYPGSQLVVETQSVYGPDDRLAAAQVSYYTTHPEGGLKRVALDRDQRANVHADMDWQLHPEALRRVR